jgi:hypothetical protein
MLVAAVPFLLPHPRVACSRRRLEEERQASRGREEAAASNRRHFSGYFC